MSLKHSRLLRAVNVERRRQRLLRRNVRFVRRLNLWLWAGRAAKLFVGYMVGTGESFADRIFPVRRVTAEPDLCALAGQPDL